MKTEIIREVYTPAKKFCQKLIDEIRDLQIPNSMDLYSWAGHDAKMYAEITDTTMVFMPSIGGKSHSPLEYTDISSFELVCDNIIKLFL
ncbi:MAG: M20/M25/M40 family metallo-hydrolase [Clostridia bacterium]|nr:M20/M25/M40 family metallo-hydrolase [Clostridia bacterium]NCC45119.1 M20/M25/M40 family metallo-hydrolase [Clostridia bacterium]